MKKYSAFSLLRNAFGYNRGWSEAWRSPEPKPERTYSCLVKWRRPTAMGTRHVRGHDERIRCLRAYLRGFNERGGRQA